MDTQPRPPRRVAAHTSEHEVYLSTGAIAPARQNREPLPDTLLRRVKQFSGRLSTEAVTSMQQQLPFFGDLDAAQRAGVQMIVQTAVVNFLEWLQNPESDIRFSLDAFQLIPQDLARRLTLSQTVDMVRVAMEFFEQWLPALARNERQLVVLTEAVLRYGRELGFAAASVYAAAAESRGAWDTRLEALVVDAVVRGDTGPDMLSRAATLNWDASAPATVLVGTPPADQGVSVVGSVHAVAHKHDRAALAVVQGSRLVTVVSGDLTDSKAGIQFLQGTGRRVLRRPSGDRPDHARAGVGARERGGGPRRDGGGRRVARGAPAGACCGVAAGARTARRRRRGDRDDRTPGRSAGRGGVRVGGDAGRISGLWRGRRDVRTATVRPSQYCSISTKANQRDHRSGPDEPAGRVRTPNRGNRWSFGTDA